MGTIFLVVSTRILVCVRPTPTPTYYAPLCGWLRPWVWACVAQLCAFCVGGMRACGVGQLSGGPFSEFRVKSSRFENGHLFSWVGIATLAGQGRSREMSKPHAY